MATNFSMRSVAVTLLIFTIILSPFAVSPGSSARVVGRGKQPPPYKHNFIYINVALIIFDMEYMQNFFSDVQFALLVYVVHLHRDRELVVPVSAAAVEVLSKLKFRTTHLEANEGLYNRFRLAGTCILYHIIILINK